MGRPHEGADPSLFIWTRLTSHETLGVARLVVEGTRGFDVESFDKDSLRVAVNSRTQETLIIFDMTQVQVSDGTPLSTQVVDHVASREAIFLSALGSRARPARRRYEKFLKALVRTFQAADPAARYAVGPAPATT